MVKVTYKKTTSFGQRVRAAEARGKAQAAKNAGSSRNVRSRQKEAEMLNKKLQGLRPGTKEFNDIVRRINEIGYQPVVAAPETARTLQLLQKQQFSQLLKKQNVAKDRIVKVLVRQLQTMKPNSSQFNTKLREINRLGYNVKTSSTRPSVSPSVNPNNATISAAKYTPKEYFTSTVTKAPKAKGLDRIQQILSQEKGRQLQKIETSKSGAVGERVFRGVFVLGALGVGRGLTGVAQTLRNPYRTAKELFKAATRPAATAKAIATQASVDPVGTVAEFFVFNKALRLTGEGIKASPVGKYVATELYIRAQPKELQTPIRKILNAVKAQNKVYPNVKDIKSVDFVEVKSLTRPEAKALTKTLKETDSVVFGSVVSRTLSKKKTPLPKDVDLATKNVKVFNEAFLKNIPKSARKNYKIKGEKIYRGKEPILDVKPISRLIQRRNILTGRGKLPVSTTAKRSLLSEKLSSRARLKAKTELLTEQLNKLRRINNKLEKQYQKARNKAARSKIQTKIAKNNKKIVKIGRSLKISDLTRFVSKPGISRLISFKTGKLTKVGGIKMTGFQEQTLRKALGTLQVLLERNARRAKDPQSLLITLEVQLENLKKVKPLTQIGKIKKARRIKTIEEAIKLLKSKSFAKLLERKVPGITKDYPLVNKINLPKLRKIKASPKARIARRITKPRAKPNPKPKKTPTQRTARAVKRIKRSSPKSSGSKLSRLPKSRLSRLPTSRLSKLPASQLSRLGTSKLSQLSPSKLSKLPASQLSKLPASKIPISLLPRSTISKLPPSKLSRIPPSKLSKLPTSKLTPSVIRALIPKVPKIPKVLRKKPRDRKAKRKIEEWLKRQPKVYRPSLAAVLFDITGYKVPKSITGVEIRPVIVNK